MSAIPLVSGVDLGSVQIMPFRGAVLCEDCLCVTSSPGEACVACGSKALLLLARVLDRVPGGCAGSEQTLCVGEAQ